MQNHMEIISTTAKLFVGRLRLRVQKEQSPHSVAYAENFLWVKLRHKRVTSQINFRPTILGWSGGKILQNYT